MDKSEVIETVYEVAEKNNYDKRFVPFMQEYFFYCTSQYNWDKSTLNKKLNEYTDKIKKIEFLNIGIERCKIDFDNKCILLDEKIKTNTSDEIIEQYINAALEEQNKILNTECVFSKDTSRFVHEVRETLKIYSTKLSKEKLLLEINNLIQQRDYDKRFAPFIKEYFLRSAKIYNWNRDELVKKIKNYKENVHALEAKRLKKKCVEFNPEQSKIFINKNLWTYSNEIVIKNLFREQGYATDYTKREKNTYEHGLYSNANANSQEKSLNEYAEEVAANYLTGRVPYSNELYTTCRISEKERRDYNSKTSYVVSMIVAAFGMSEFDFAMLKDKGRARFDEYFKEKFYYMDIENYIEEFSSILCRIEEAPESLFSTKEVSEEYAKMYNLSSKILEERIKHETEGLENKELKRYKVKAHYARHKIADSLKQAKRNQSLEWHVVMKKVEDKDIIRRYSKISKLAQRRFEKVAKEIYKNSDTEFDNAELKAIVVREFKMPILGKIYNALNKSKQPKLTEADQDHVIDCLRDEEIDERLNSLEGKDIIVPKKEIFN